MGIIDPIDKQGANKMTVNQAIKILQNIGNDFGHDVLEVLTYMKENIDDFNAIEKRAFRVVFVEMSKLFE
jgi:hypothetical protein